MNAEDEGRRGILPRSSESTPEETRQDAASTEPRYIAKPKRRRRWWLITLTIIIALICLWWFWPRHDRILDLAAELDQRDPGWRWDELRASQPKIPDGENGLPLLIGIAGATPGAVGKARPSLVIKTVPGYGQIWNSLGGDLAAIDPTEGLNDDFAKELSAELQLTEVVRKQLLDLLRFPSARDDVGSFSLRFFSAPKFPYGIQALPELLSIELEAALLAQDRRLIQERAHLLVHGLKLLGESGGSWNLREYFNSFTQAGRRLERMLAHGDGEEAILKKMQDELMGIDLKKQYIQWLRLQRASDFALYDFLANHREEYSKLLKLAWYQQLLFSLMENDLYEGQAKMVEFFTYRLDQFKGLPDAQVKIKQMIEKLERSQPNSDNVVQRKWNEIFNSVSLHALNRINHCSRNVDPSFQQARAAREVMVAALVAERFRLKNGRWPNDLHELVPTFLVEVPKDPCSPGNELRWKVTPTGRVVYSVGLDGKDGGGQCEWKDENEMVDVAFRLFDQRVQQKAKSPA